MRFDIEDKEEREEKRRREDKRRANLILIFFVVIGAIVLLITVLIVRSISQRNQTPAPTSTPPTTITPSAPPIEQKKLTVFDEDSSERPIAVMIDNAIGDAKHAGLQDSYLNYEILVEGGITRIMSIYKDKDVSLIGPIRSSRHYFLDYALESDAIYVHYGWSPYAEQDEKAMNINSVNGLTDPDPFRRDTNAVAPHNVFTKMVYIKNFLGSTNYSQYSNNWQLLNYSVDPITLEETGYTPKVANRITIPYSANETRTYNYDANNQYYMRVTNGKAQIDRRSNEQLHYKNIIIERVDYEVIDGEGRLNLNTTGTGTGYIITNGAFLPIRWSKSSRTAKTTYTYENGNEVQVNDGNTFIQIVPTNCNITIE
ncbi:MAG: DUF3048 domain-containing protein [Bacilli bacterium]|nr:DUF3048 domain-containing protein [Bacilli bacterium]